LIDAVSEYFTDDDIFGDSDLFVGGGYGAGGGGLFQGGWPSAGGIQMPDIQKQLGYTPKDFTGGLGSLKTGDDLDIRHFTLPDALLRGAAQGAGGVMPSFEPDTRYGGRSISGDLPEVAIQDVRLGQADPNAGAYPGNMLFGSAGGGLEGIPPFSPGLFNPRPTPGADPWAKALLLEYSCQDGGRVRIGPLFRIVAGHCLSLRMGKEGNAAG